MKHLLTAAILAMLSTAAWATVSEPPTPEPPTPEPPQERPETPNNGGNRDVPHGCLTTWSTAEQRLIPCDEAKPTAGPKGQIIFEGKVTP